MATHAQSPYRSRGLRSGPFLQDVARVEPAAGAAPTPAQPADRFTDEYGHTWTFGPDGMRIAAAGAEELFAGEEGPPVADVTCVAAGSDGAVWLGSPKGAACLRDGRWRYYGGRRWLPDDRVTALEPLPDGAVRVRTAGGVSTIERVPFTLEQKAAHYEAITCARHERLGYVAEIELQSPGDVTRYRHVATDNDGLWTALYVVAECFRWAVTRDPQARDNARRSMEAVLLLVDVTGVPGYPARAVAGIDEDIAGVDCESVGWSHRSPTHPDLIWKGDTSSDEIDGHYLCWPVYHALVADGAEKRRIEAACRSVTDHILDHDFLLVGPEGPTTWGMWQPENLNRNSRWRAERGLNAMEMLSYLRVAMHLCGDARYEQAYRSLVAQHHYALNTVRQKVRPPVEEDNHSDDELAWCAYHPLLTIETDPALRRLYLMSMERTYQMLRGQRSPFHNFLYGALTGRPCDAEAGLEWLHEASLDLVDWTMTNSHRPDVAFNTDPDRFNKPELTRVLSPAERALERWNSNPYRPDGGTGGRREVDGAFWLLPYWLGRYAGILGPDEA